MYITCIYIYITFPTLSKYHFIKLLTLDLIFWNKIQNQKYAASTSLIKSIRAKLLVRFNPEILEVVDDCEKYKFPPKAPGTHLSVTIISEEFKGMPVCQVV